MAKVNGTTFLMYLFLNSEWKAIGSTTTCSLDITMDTPDATTKDSDGWAESIAGIRSASGSFGQLYDPTDTFSVSEVFDLIDARDTVKLKIASTETGSEYYEFNAHVSGLNYTFDMEQPVGVEGSFTSTGKVEKKTVSS
jgi:hypothetical protein